MANNVFGAGLAAAAALALLVVLDILMLLDCRQLLVFGGLPIPGVA
jgi:hypothetical protein